jgi:hypothetical protein
MVPSRPHRPFNRFFSLSLLFHHRRVFGWRDRDPAGADSGRRTADSSI